MRNWMYGLLVLGLTLALAGCPSKNSNNPTTPPNSTGATNTITSSATPTATVFTTTPTSTATRTTTFTVTLTPTPSNSRTSSPTLTVTLTATATATPTVSNTATGTNTPVFTPTDSPTPTLTFTLTPTISLTPTTTFSTTNTSTPALTFTSTLTPTFTITTTATLSMTNTFTPTVTTTSTLTPTITATPTTTFSTTNTSTPTNTSTLTLSPTITPTPTITLTFTPTFTFPCTPVTFGSTTSDSPANLLYSSEAFFSDYTAPYTGSLQDIQVNLYTQAAGPASVQAAVYTANGSGTPQNLVAISSVQLVNTNGGTSWVTFNLPGNATLTEGTTYCLCMAGVYFTGGLATYMGVAATSASNEGIGVLSGGSLSSAPSGANLYSGGYWDIKADYCAFNLPTITLTPTITQTPTITLTPTITISPTITESGTPTVTGTPTVSDSPTPTGTVTNTPTITLTPTATLSPTFTVTEVVCTPSVFGNTSTTSPSYPAGVGNPVLFGQYAAPYSGTLRDVQLYMQTAGSSSVSVQAAVYTANGSGYPQNLVGLSAVQLVSTGGNAQWVTFGIPGNVSLTGGVSYCVCSCELWDVNGVSSNVGISSGGQSLGEAELNGYDLSNTPLGSAFASGYVEIHAEYCAVNVPTPTVSGTPTPTGTPGNSPTITSTPTPHYIYAYSVPVPAGLLLTLGVQLNGSVTVMGTSNINNATVAYYTSATGSWVSFGGTVGTATGQFGLPNAVGVDASGNLFVADYYSQHNVQEYKAASQAWTIISNGPGTGAGQFADPMGLAVDGSGNVYVLDDAVSLIQKYVPGTGAWSTVITGFSGGEYAGGMGTNAAATTFVVADSGFNNLYRYAGGGWSVFANGLNSPSAAALDSKGDVFFTISGDNDIAELNPSGASVTLLGGTGSSPDQFENPDGIAVDSQGTLYVADQGNNRVQVFQYVP